MTLLRNCLVICLLVGILAGSEHHGQVTFNELPVPGATVTASQGSRKVSDVTDERGFYAFSDLADGTWTVEVEMSGFGKVQRDVTIQPNTPASKWELKLLPLEQIQAEIQSTAEPVAHAAVGANSSHRAAQAQQPATEEEDDLSQRAADGFLINGSVNVGAASPFAQAAAFGNSRARGRKLYNGGLGILLNSSALDARPFSLTGQDTPKAAYSRVTGALTLGGPLQIPHLLRSGPNFFLSYEWTRNSNATTQSALVPKTAERNGVFARPIVDPLSSTPFPANSIPQSRISTQARSLLNFYPLPNFEAGGRYNYQTAILSPSHQDAFQSRLNKALASKDQVFGRFAFQSTRTDSPSLFGFLDTADTTGINTDANWLHRFNQEWFLTLGYQFSRFSSRVRPYFENRTNVSGEAGIVGNSQDPMNWGPPRLDFSSGIAALSDAQSSFDRNQTSGFSWSTLWNRGVHNIAFGADLRRQQFNSLSQQDPRGTFTFTGAATGADFADYLLGIPTTSSIAFGNADKYFRGSIYDAYINDDWRVGPSLTLNAGVRWEYGAPVTELQDRLVNLDIAPGFAAVAPMVAGDGAGALTGIRYPRSLVRPDKLRFAPRTGIAWRPVPGSSLVIRAGYGIYCDTSVYRTLALQMAQQPPLSKTVRVSNSTENPLTLANGFSAASSTPNNTFAVDPDFRIGYAQNWQLSIQRDLPGSLQMRAAYVGIKGTRAMQEFLPNTFPAGAANPCDSCPSGFAYITSSGNSTRQAAELQVRRRLRNGLTASLQYTFSKSMDDAAALGGAGAATSAQNITAQNSRSLAGGADSTRTGAGGLAIAQNWLDLGSERSLSSFDQRHYLSLQMQYTTGIGLGGGALFGGWTFGTQITAGSGLPQTPVYLAPVQGTGVTGSIRPDYTGASLYDAPAGYFLNRSAYRAPLPGQWGNAGRNSIIGPAQRALNASLGRTFLISDRLNLDLRVDSVNALNRVNYTAWNTTVNGSQFGLPVAANPMRNMQLTLRVRF